MNILTLSFKTKTVRRTAVDPSQALMGRWLPDSQTSQDKPDLLLEGSRILELEGNRLVDTAAGKGTRLVRKVALK